MTTLTFFQPNGRFEVGKKICLSISGHHPETWQPSWGIRTALLAIIGFMPTPGQGTIGSLDYPADERKRLARKSAAFVCPECGVTAALLKEEQEGDKETRKEAEEIAKQFSFKVSIQFYGFHREERAHSSALLGRRRDPIWRKESQRRRRRSILF